MASITDTLPRAVRMEGGVFKVGDSRVSLDSLVYAFNEGMNVAEIQRQYDSVSLTQVNAAIDYYLQNKTKVDAYIADHETKRELAWCAHETKFPPKITSEKLLARKNGEDPNWPK